MSLVSKFCWFLWHLAVVPKQFTKGTISKQDNEQNILAPTISQPLFWLTQKEESVWRLLHLTKQTPFSGLWRNCFSLSMVRIVNFIHLFLTFGKSRDLQVITPVETQAKLCWICLLSQFFGNHCAFTTHPPYFRIRQCFWWVLFNCIF